MTAPRYKTKQYMILFPRMANVKLDSGMIQVDCTDPYNGNLWQRFPSETWYTKIVSLRFIH